MLYSEQTRKNLVLTQKHQGMQPAQETITSCDTEYFRRKITAWNITHTRDQSIMETVDSNG